MYGGLAKEHLSFRLGKLSGPAKAERLSTLELQPESKLSRSRFAADASREPWTAFITRTDTYSARREHAMPVDVIHAVMGLVYLLTWACIGQMNVRRRTGADVEPKRRVR